MICLGVGQEHLRLRRRYILRQTVSVQKYPITFGSLLDLFLTSSLFFLPYPILYKYLYISLRMSNFLPPLAMSQIIASDAPLLSPVSADSFWEQHSPTSTTDSFAFNYYSLPPSPPNSVGSTSTDSPVPTSRMLKMRMSPEGSDSEQLCLPTHQVFDFPDLSNPLSPPSPSPSSPQQERLSISIKSSANPGPAKRSASPTPGVTKKPRAVGERISSKVSYTRKNAQLMYLELI